MKGLAASFRGLPPGTTSILGKGISMRRRKMRYVCLTGSIRIVYPDVPGFLFHRKGTGVRRLRGRARLRRTCGPRGGWQRARGYGRTIPADGGLSGAIPPPAIAFPPEPSQKWSCTTSNGRIPLRCDLGPGRDHVLQSMHLEAPICCPSGFGKSQQRGFSFC